METNPGFNEQLNSFEMKAELKAPRTVEFQVTSTGGDGKDLLSGGMGWARDTHTEELVGLLKRCLRTFIEKTK